MLRRCTPWLRVGIFPLQLDPPTKEHNDLLRKLLASHDLGLHKIIVLPYTRFAVTIQHSMHLAAMVGLSTQHLPHVDVDYTALEMPSSRLPRIAQLMEEHSGDASLLHWYHDRGSIATWDKSDKYLDHGELVFVQLEGVADRQNHGDEQSWVDRLESSESVKRFVTSKTRGHEARRRLFEGEVHPMHIVEASVLKYVESHHLYRDFRRAQRFHYGTVHSHRASNTGHNYTFGASVALEGTIPRVEIHADPHNKSAQELAARLTDLCVSSEAGETPDLIVPIGGDGFMMQTIRREWQRFIPFFGVNAGHVGYLLNDAAHLEEMISAPMKLYQTPMLYVEAFTRHEETGEVSRQEELAFNDTWLERRSGQTALINVSINGERRLTKARGDGILVSTVAGSTAYAVALGASPLPITASMLQLVGSNIIKPARWKPVHLNQDAIIELEAQDTGKRPCSGYADGVDLGKVDKLRIRYSRVAGVQLAFSKSCDLQSKLFKLQFPKD